MPTHPFSDWSSTHNVRVVCHRCPNSPFIKSSNLYLIVPSVYKALKSSHCSSLPFRIHMLGKSEAWLTASLNQCQDRYIDLETDYVKCFALISLSHTDPPPRHCLSKVFSQNSMSHHTHARTHTHTHTHIEGEQEYEFFSSIVSPNFPNFNHLVYCVGWEITWT